MAITNINRLTEELNARGFTLVDSRQIKEEGSKTTYNIYNKDGLFVQVAYAEFRGITTISYFSNTCTLGDDNLTKHEFVTPDFDTVYFDIVDTYNSTKANQLVMDFVGKHDMLLISSKNDRFLISTGSVNIFCLYYDDDADLWEVANVHWDIDNKFREGIPLVFNRLEDALESLI